MWTVVCVSVWVCVCKGRLTLLCQIYAIGPAWGVWVCPLGGAVARNTLKLTDFTHRTRAGNKQTQCWFEWINILEEIDYICVIAYKPREFSPRAFRSRFNSSLFGSMSGSKHCCVPRVSIHRIGCRIKLITIMLFSLTLHISTLTQYHESRFPSFTGKRKRRRKCVVGDVTLPSGPITGADV